MGVPGYPRSQSIHQFAFLLTQYQLKYHYLQDSNLMEHLESGDMSVYASEDLSDDPFEPLSQDLNCEEDWAIHALDLDIIPTLQSPQSQPARMNYKTDEIKRIRLTSIQFEKESLLKRLKQLEEEEQSLGVMRSGTPSRYHNPNLLEKRSHSEIRSKDMPPSTQEGRLPSQPQKQRPLPIDQNPYVTAVRPSISQTQQKYLANLNNLSQQQLTLASKGFGMKKAPKKQMIFLLQKLKHYLEDNSSKNPYLKELAKKS